MKAEELLRRYRQGERNFAGVKLRGQSFQEQDLLGANFSQETLIGANFSRAEAGLQRRWVVILILLIVLLASVAGFFEVFNGAAIAQILIPELLHKVMGWTLLLTQIVIFGILLHRGLSFTFVFGLL